MIGVPQVALKLGLSHAPLANAALDALEVWSSRIPRDTMQPYYREILPHLDGYLKTAAADGDFTSLSIHPFLLYLSLERKLQRISSFYLAVLPSGNLTYLFVRYAIILFPFLS